MKTLILIALAALLAACSQAQTITKGVIYDENNKPLAGVAIQLKGSSQGTLSDVNGEFIVLIHGDSAQLVLSFLGYQPVEKMVRAGERFKVAMTPDIKELEEVMVIGYGIQKKEDITSSVAYPAASRKMAVGESVYDRAGFMPKDFNTEGYTTVHENGFRKVSLNPLSTFSIDVDRASYSNVRRFLNYGQLPPRDAVRVEELINYFTYEYPQPKAGEPFSVNTALSVCPWNNENYLLHVGLQGKSVPTAMLPPSNLVFLLDVSGSMDADNKLPLLKSALRLLVAQMRPQDKVAIVVYAGAAGLVLPSTTGNRKNEILSALDQLSAGGSTAGGAGIKLAYKTAAENFIRGGNNRIILATDGDFNVGASSNAEMERLVEQEREKGIFISVLGFGMGNYKDDKMEIIADKGNGNYAYIDNIREAEKTLVSEFGGTLFTIAKDVKIQMEFNPAVIAEYRLVGYENRLLNEEDFDDDKKDAGEIGAGHTVTALYEIRPVNRHIAGNTVLRYQPKPTITENKSELALIKLRYKEPDGQQSRLIEKVISNEPTEWALAPENLIMAAAVAQWGMLLRNSEFKGSANYRNTEEMALKAKGTDREGYRAEFISLLRLSSKLANNTASVSEQ